jgi:hypothetical protein
MHPNRYLITVVNVAGGLTDFGRLLALLWPSTTVLAAIKIRACCALAVGRHTRDLPNLQETF